METTISIGLLWLSLYRDDVPIFVNPLIDDRDWPIVDKKALIVDKIPLITLNSHYKDIQNQSRMSLFFYI